MLIEYSIDDNGDDRGEVGFSNNFDEDNDEATGLKNGARKRQILALPGRSGERRSGLKSHQPLFTIFR